jgi:hypothetical protein
MPTGRWILRPVNPHAHLSTALARTPADDDQPHGDVSISETRSPLKVKSSSDDEQVGSRAFAYP